MPAAAVDWLLMHVSQHGFSWRLVGAQPCQQVSVTGHCACQLCSLLLCLTNKVVVKVFSHQLFDIKHADWNACQIRQMSAGRLHRNEF